MQRHGTYLIFVNHGITPRRILILIERSSMMSVYVVLYGWLVEISQKTKKAYSFRAEKLLASSSILTELLRELTCQGHQVFKDGVL